MSKNPDKYIPAFGVDRLAPLYDLIMPAVMRESTIKPHLVEQMGIKKGHRVLDLGCGTATLTILIKKAQPEAEVTGLDIDPKILEIARSKVARKGLSITLDQGLASELPYNDNSFDRVVSSLVFHHLTRENKVLAFKEIFRVIRPGGELHVADFGKPHNTLMYLISLFVRHFEETSDNINGLLPEMFRMAGFGDIEETARYMTINCTLSL
ncbi:Putative arsenite methyltransferase [uncultured archaeon]|nr:Putative arsenite methyltransferase [uncultured archaeon]